ncbi:MAG: hypothetical protein N7Q72_05520 [Spiroplasma sp. Tabriz.8]|nr:hypothetical protein [Spiroplasma sp. Tabriz.8]
MPLGSFWQGGQTKQAIKGCILESGTLTKEVLLYIYIYIYI